MTPELAEFLLEQVEEAPGMTSVAPELTELEEAGPEPWAKFRLFLSAGVEGVADLPLYASTIFSCFESV